MAISVTPDQVPAPMREAPNAAKTVKPPHISWKALAPIAAAIVIATLPLVLLVLLFERRIASGLTRGAIKG